MLRINPDNNCMIQKLDCDGNWQTWIDVSRCSAASTFDLQVNIGGINFGSGQPEISGCHDYDLIHESTGITLIPVTMSTGDTIEFSGWKGAATDGFALPIIIPPPWYCASGQGFALNECHDDPGPAEVEDPFQDFYHMRAIFVIDNVGYDAYNTTVTVPLGVLNEQGYVILNDHNLSDNSGTMQFHARVCRVGELTTWTKEFRFVDGPQGWESDTRNGFGAVHAAGQGWGPDIAGPSGIGFDVIACKLQLPASAHITFCAQYMHLLDIRDDPGSADNDASLFLPYPNSEAELLALHPFTDMSQFAVVDRNTDLVQFYALVYPTDNATAQAYLTRVVLQGDGPEPVWP